MSYGTIERGPMAADNFTQISNDLFRDPRLSAKAKGIFGFVSTHRSGWGMTPESIAACMTDGVSAVNTGLRELERYGYLERFQDRNADGTMSRMRYRITDIPRSAPVSENRTPVVSCENTDVEESDGYLRRSEPLVDFPHAVDPRAADRAHKKTNSKKTSRKNTSSPSIPQSGPSAAGQEGGGDASQQEEQSSAAVFVDSLPYRGRLPGPKQRAHLVAAAAAALTAGWSEEALRRQLTADTSNAKSMAAVYRYRLEPENLPAPPVPAVPGPRTVVNDTRERDAARECEGRDGMCGRPTGGSASGLCRSCEQDRAAADSGLTTVGGGL